MRSPIIIVVMLVFVQKNPYRIEPSTTRRFWRPCTWPCWSATAIGSEAGPILQVPEICWPVVTSRNRYSFKASSLISSVSVGSMRSAIIRLKPRARLIVPYVVPSRACVGDQTHPRGTASRRTAAHGGRWTAVAVLQHSSLNRASPACGCLVAPYGSHPS